MKTKIIFLVLVGFWFSCNETNITPPAQDDSIESHAIFNSPDQFYSTGSDLLKMTDKELDDWERENSFQSFRSVFKKAQDEWNNVSNAADTLLILNKYQDVLTS